MLCRFLSLLIFLTLTGRAEIGDILWSYDMGEPIFASPTLARDGTIYVGSNASTFAAIQATDSEATLQWTYTANDWIDATAAIGEDGTIYVGTYDSTLVALDPETGEPKWETTLGESEGQFGIVQASPAINSEGLIVISTSAGFIHGILPSGEEDWVFEIGADTRSSPAIDTNDRVYFGADDGKVYCLNSLGETQWTFDVDDAGEEASRVYGSPALDADGNVYIGAGNGSLYSLTSDGQLRWKFDTPEAIDVCPAIDSDGIVYVASRNGSLYAIDSSGKEVWSRFLGDIFYSSPIIDSNGFIYIAYFAGAGVSKVVAFAPGGQEVWETQIDAIIDSSLVITVDGLLLVGAFDGKLYALEGSAPLGYEHPWPRFRRDTRGRGRVIETPLPSILVGPQSLAVSQGGTASFSVETQEGTEVAGWRRNGQLLSGETALSLSIPDIGTDDVMFYDVILSNERGEVLANEVFLSLFAFTASTISFTHPVDSGFQITRSTDLMTWTPEPLKVSRVPGPVSGLETSSLALDFELPVDFVRLSWEQ